MDYFLVSAQRSLDPLKQLGQAGPETLADLLDIHQRHVPHSPLDAAVVGPVHPTALRRLFLVDPLLLPDSADGPAKADADIERHRMTCWRHAADAYTADESHFH